MDEAFNQGTEPSPTSFASLLRELRDETMTLLRQEVALAKAEVSQKTSQVTRSATKCAVGGFVAYAGVIVLLIGLGNLLAVGLARAGLDATTAAWLGHVGVGLVVAIIGYAMLAKAKRDLSASHLAPEQTLQSMRENQQWVRNKLHQSHEPAL